MNFIKTYQLTIFQLVAHTITLYALIVYNWQDWLLMIPFYILLIGIGISVTYHRLCTHKAFQFPNWFKFIGLFFGTVSGQGTCIDWVTVHTQHHANSDTINDTHSPHNPKSYKLYLGMLTSLSGINPKYSNRARNDLMQQWFTQYYWYINIVYLIIMLSIGIKWAIFGYFVPAAVGWFAVIYGVAMSSHKYGYVTYKDTHDHSRNNIIAGLLVFGEGYQNNHHKFPNDGIFSKRWYELDLLGSLFTQITQRTKKN